MKNFEQYLGEAKHYLYDKEVAELSREKESILRIVRKFGLEGAFNEAVAGDSEWQELASHEVFYFVDFVRSTPFNSDFKPYLAIIKPEHGEKAVLKLVIKRDQFAYISQG